MGGSGKKHAQLTPAAPLFRPAYRRATFPGGEGFGNSTAAAELLENALSLRTSAHAGVAIPRIFKHLGRKTKLFPSNRGAATPVTSVTGSQRHTFLTAPFLYSRGFSSISDLPFSTPPVSSKNVNCASLTKKCQANAAISRKFGDVFTKMLNSAIVFMSQEQENILFS